MMTTIVLFTRKGKSYRMRLPRLHMHPGDIDWFEVASKDMLGQTSWGHVPLSCADIPSGEWLVRKALWHLLDGGTRSTGPDFVVIDLGEV
jgi:hypothetical protein